MEQSRRSVPAGMFFFGIGESLAVAYVIERVKEEMVGGEAKIKS